jgi:hypothetical protein
MLLIVIAFIFFERVKKKPNPRLSQKPKSPRNKEQSPSTNLGIRHSNLAVQQTSLQGKKYIPSYQSNPDAVKQVERFLSGATTRGDNSIAEKQNDADEDAADEISLGDKGREYPAGEKGENEAVNTQETVQLELGMEDTRGRLPAVNE